MQNFEKKTRHAADLADGRSEGLFQRQESVMPNELRYIPEETTVFELTARTIGGRLLLTPTREMVQEWVGLLSIASAKWPAVRVHQICVLGNHFHLLHSVVGVDRVNVRGRWASFVQAGTARIAKRQHGLAGPVWARRYRAIAVLSEAALRDRVKYVMAQAVSAGLVAKPGQWPGLNCADALCRGSVLSGYYTTADSRRRARRLGVPDARTAEKRQLILAPLPSHTNWTVAQRQAWYRHIEREIIQEERARIAHRPRRYPTRNELLTPKPAKTIALPSTPAPKAHVGQGNGALYRAWVAAKQHFVMLWREALARWVNGAPPDFPPGGWQPFLSDSRRLKRLQL
jgi:hypothetical protein